MLASTIPVPVFVVQPGKKQAAQRQQQRLPHRSEQQIAVNIENSKHEMIPLS